MLKVQTAVITVVTLGRVSALLVGHGHFVDLHRTGYEELLQVFQTSWLLLLCFLSLLIEAGLCIPCKTRGSWSCLLVKARWLHQRLHVVFSGKFCLWSCSISELSAVVLMGRSVCLTSWLGAAWECCWAVAEGILYLSVLPKTGWWQQLQSDSTKLGRLGCSFRNDVFCHLSLLLFAISFKGLCCFRTALTNCFLLTVAENDLFGSFSSLKFPISVWFKIKSEL